MLSYGPHMLTDSEIAKQIETLKNGKWPATSFFQNMQLAIDQNKWEYIEFLLYYGVSLCNDYQSIHREKVELQYIVNKIFYNAQDTMLFFEACNTLDDAEKQQRALERQIDINSYELPSLLSEAPEPLFFERLLLLAKKYSFFIYNIEETEWIERAKNLYHKCENQPIALVLLPVILTVFCTDNIEHKNVFAYLKNKKRRFSQALESNIYPLFSDILDLMEEFNLSEVTTLNIPIFFWDKIVDTFCSAHKLRNKDTENAKNLFEKLRGKNGPSREENAELSQCWYGSAIQHISKLCNLNTYIWTKLNSGRSMRISEALKQLEQESLLPLDTLHGLYPTSKKVPRSRVYLDLYYYEFTSADLSFLALMRYYHLPFEQLNYSRFAFFEKIEALISSLVSYYVERIKKQYFPADALVIETRTATNRTKARVFYKKSNVYERKKYILDCKKFAVKIAQTFNEKDYRCFISCEQNFDYLQFQNYLEAYCREKDISIYDEVSDIEACFLADEAFSVIADLCGAYLQKNIYEIWRKRMEISLYGEVNELS